MYTDRMFKLWRRKPEAEFWKWFQRHEAELFQDESKDAELFRTGLRTELKRVHPGLVWEVGRVESDGRRRLVISADGIREVFSVVESLVDAAPKLERWEIVRFRPREPDYGEFTIKFRGVEVTQADVECVLSTNGVQIGIRMFIKGCPDPASEPFVGVAFLIADAALGEYDMECKVGAFKVEPFESDADNPSRFSYSELRERFDEAFDEHCVPR